MRYCKSLKNPRKRDPEGQIVTRRGRRFYIPKKLTAKTKRFKVCQK